MTPVDDYGGGGGVGGGGRPLAHAPVDDYVGGGGGCHGGGSGGGGGRGRLSAHAPVDEQQQQQPFDRGSEPGGGPSSDYVEEVNETFWARRASAIQQLFTKWDCNQLSNDAFTARLQEVLGEAVEVSRPDSEFVKLANKHRAARNMKFASLMSALRRDAQSSHTRRFGRPPSHTGLSQYAGSYAGSTYEASEACSEAPSHAAGRPTGAGSGVAGMQTPSQPRGRRPQYPYAESQLSGSAPRSLESWDERAPISPAAQLPPSSAPFAYGSPTPAVAAAAPRSPRGGVGGTSRASEADSNYEADSQREVFTQRNRTGHGNILTWGNDSRSITPHKERQTPAKTGHGRAPPSYC